MNADRPSLATMLGSGDAARAGTEVRGGLARAETARHNLTTGYGPPTFRLFEEHVADALAAQLDSPVAGLVLDGWRKYRELVEAAEKSRDHPESREAVQIATHEIEATNRYPVDVYVNGVRTTTLTFELSVFLELRGLVVELRNGSIVAVRAGELQGGARLGLDGVVLAEGRLPALPVGPLLSLGAGLELVPARPAGSPPPPSPAPSAASRTAAVAPDSSDAPWWTRTSASATPGDMPWWERA